MNFDTAPSTIRKNAAQRLRACLAAFDELLFDHHAVAKWIAEAAPRTDRKRWLRCVCASRAAQVYSGPATRDAGMNRDSLTRWDRAVYAQEMQDRAFLDAVAREVDAIRQRIIKPVAIPAPINKERAKA